MAVTLPTGPLYGAVEYLRALQALLPRGRAWPRDADAVLTSLLAGFAEPFAGSNAAASSTLRSAFPATADALLTEWESSLGLPRPGTSLPDTDDGRRASVVAALTVAGSQSVPYFVSLAARMGHFIVIETYRPTRVTDSVMRPLYGDEWAHAWTATSADPPDSALNAALADAAPAHTILRIA